MQHWLLKSEPDAFSIDDLKAKKISMWDGVRNYQARNFMKDKMQVGDLAFFYHSNAKPAPHIAGIIKINSKTYPDPTQFDPKSKYFDEKSTEANPRWWLIDVKFIEKFKEPIYLSELKSNKKLKDMMLLQKGSRLSIQPVSLEEWNEILDRREI
jgi:predicted RNA-binding protein with PUA-like domain